MAFSPLACKFIPAYEGNYTKNRKAWGQDKITEICIHYMAGNLSIETCGQIWQTPGRNGSSTYGIGSDGRIACYVDENDIAWCNSNWDSNVRSASIETANFSPSDSRVSDEALNSLIELVADIAKRNGMGKLVKGQNLTWHKMYADTSCIPVDSELLTKKGWKKLKDIEIGDEVASADIDNLNITFEEVYDKVPIKKQDTYTCKDLTATKDHRLVYSIQSNKNKYRIDYFNNLLDGKNYYIPLAGTNKNEGLKLTDDMIKFYIATQADGHYIIENNSYYGLEFHLKKERKIERIKKILENIHLDYTLSNKNDGSVSIRIWNQDNINIVNDICEKYLKNKCFTWDWLLLNKEQAKLFLDEILEWDGCKSGDKYTSSNKINLDIVNAIASLNNVGSRIIGNDVIFRDTPYITLSTDIKRNKSGKNIEVSCVSVKTGLILIRQNGKTFIVGNCPGDYLLSKLDYIVEQVNKINAPAKIKYRSHLQTIGWQDWKKDGETSGTTGESRRLEAIQIDYNKPIYAKAHIQKDGWVDYGEINKDTVIGTTGESKRLECLCLKCEGIKYRVHIEGSGWSCWTNADGISTLGSVGQKLRIEAIEIKEV